MSQNIILSEIYEDENTKRTETVNIANSIMAVLFRYYSSEWDGLIVDGEDEPGLDSLELDNFIEYSWSAVSAILASSGFKMIGTDQDGNYIISMKPVDSVRDFLISTDASGDDDGFFQEDYVDVADGSSTFGQYDKFII